MKRIIFFAFILLYSSQMQAQSSSFNNRPWNDPAYPIIIDPYAGNPVNFDKLVTDKRVAGIIHKASQGLVADTKYKNRKQLAAANNLVFASYHLGTNTDPVKQADFYLQQVGTDAKEPLALDIEDIGGNNISLANATIFITRIYEKTNRYPLVYVNNKVFEAINAQYDRNSVFAKCGLWYARFVNTLPQLSTKVWDKVTLWQFSCEINCKENGKCLYNVPGTLHDIDVNVYNGDIESLKEFWNNNSNGSTGQSSLDKYLQENFVYPNVKKQLVGTGLQCGFEEVYFVKGYNNRQQLSERCIVYKKNGTYSKSIDFITWCAGYFQVSYNHQDEHKETLQDMKDLKIDFKNGQFLVENVQITSSTEKEKELTGRFETTFPAYIEQLEECR